MEIRIRRTGSISITITVIVIVSIIRINITIDISMNNSRWMIGFLIVVSIIVGIIVMAWNTINRDTEAVVEGKRATSGIGATSQEADALNNIIGHG